MKTQTLALFLALATINCSYRSLQAQNVLSPEVQADRTVTFRLLAPHAQEVLVQINGANVALTRNERGMWEGGSEPLAPGLHDYTFKVDGTSMIDPANRLVKKWLTLGSMVEVPGQPALLTEFQPVPHGTVHRTYYQSQATTSQRPLVVYTPPGYDPTKVYPLVLLFHGFGDDETAWTEVGRAHFIADNLIGSKELAPCIIAMPYGHPVPAPGGRRADDYWQSNNDAFEKDVIEDLLPFLEQNYAVAREAAGRSIVGLSMGGGHALHIGLHHVDKFSSLGAFSAAVPQWQGAELEQHYPALAANDPVANKLKNFWIPIGKQDFLLKANEGFKQELITNGIKHEYTLVEGGHDWKLWREFLPQFLKMAVGPVQ